MPDIEAILDTLKGEDHYVPINTWTIGYLQRCRLEKTAPRPDTLRRMLLMPDSGP